MKSRLLSSLLLPLIILVGLSIFVRFYQLALPADKIFDEVYFPVFANNYLTNTAFFDAHPPLGKLIIAVGIFLFDNAPFGWRVMNALTGVLLLGAVYGFTYELTKRHQSALLALLLVAIEPMALVESRVGLINIYLALFSVFGLWFFWRWWTNKPHAPANLVIALLAFGAASAVKWIGIGALLTSLLFVGIRKIAEKNAGPAIKWWHLLLLLLIPLVYVASFLPDIMRGQDFWWWNKSAFTYHAHLTATHPYGADWWTWPIMLRPIWLYFDMPEPGRVVGILELGNIVTWVTGLLALAYTFLNSFIKPHTENKAVRERNFFLVLTYAGLYLPWIFIGRVKFIYHYFVPLLMILILLAIILDEKVFSQKDRRALGIVFLLVATAFFVYFLPLLMGLNISESWYRHHMWFRTWI